VKILVVTPGFPSARTEDFLGKFVLAEALAYARNGASVRVLTPHYPGALLREQVGKGVEVRRFRYFRPTSYQCLRQPNRPLYASKSLLGLIQVPLLLACFVVAIARHALWADILHCQWTVAALLALPAKWLLRKPTVVTARGSDLRLLPGWLNRWIHRRVDAAVDCYGPQEWNEQYKASFPARFITLPLIVDDTVPPEMPADLRAVLGDDPGFVIFFVSRLNLEYFEMYGHPGLTLIHAVHELARRGRKLKLCYIGDGDTEALQVLRGLVASYSLETSVSLLGPRVNVNEYLAFCDLGSGGSAFSGVSQELSQYRRPQLLARGFDNVDTPWRHRQNALFFDAGDVGDLVGVIGYAMADSERLRRIGEGAREMMSRYVKNLDEGGRLYCEAFGHLVDRQPVAPPATPAGSAGTNERQDA